MKKILGLLFVLVLLFVFSDLRPLTPPTDVVGPPSPPTNTPSPPVTGERVGVRGEWVGPSGSWRTAGLARAGESQAAASPSHEAMRKFYTEQCRNCHGETGKGDGPLSKVLTAPVGNLTDPKMWEKTDEQLFNIICSGKPPMPAYQSTLKEEGCRAMVTYVRTLAPRP